MADEKILQETLGKLSFLRLFKTFSMAIGHNKLLIAFAAVAVLWLAGFLMDISKTVSAGVFAGAKSTELDVFIAAPEAVSAFIDKADSANDAGVFATMLGLLSEKFNAMVISLYEWDITGFFTNIANLGRSFVWLAIYHPFYSVIFAVIFLSVMSLAGGAISRIAALEIARGEKLGAIEALRFSREKFLSLFFAPLLPMCIVAILGVAVVLLGLIGNIPWFGEIAIGVFLLFALILGAIMTLVIIGLLAGGSMMFSVLAYEGSDSFDVISRTFSYVYTKPWHLVFYDFIALVYGGICYIFVRFFAFVILSMVYLFLWLSLWASGSEAGDVSKLEVIWRGPEFFSLGAASSGYAMNWSESIAAFCVQISVGVVTGLVIAFVISFFYCSSTIVYALMRLRVDNVPISDVNTNLELKEAQAEDEQ